MKIIKLLTLGFSIAVLSACASKYNMTKEERAVAYNEFTEQQKLEKVDRIRSFRFHGWTPLGDQHLIVNASLNRPYLVTLRRKCTNLDFNQTIKINNHSNMLQAKFDSITVLDGVEINCYIESIHKLNKEQKKAMLAIGKPEKEEDSSNES